MDIQLGMQRKNISISLRRLLQFGANSIGRNFRLISHMIGLTPLLILAWEGFTGGWTVNPIQHLTLRTGKSALIMVIITLTISPLNTLFGFRPAVKARRTFGLYTFLYAFLHASIFFFLDYVFDLDLILKTVLEKRYIMAGAAAFLIFLPLGLTSFKWWMKRLGKNWKRLHRLVYLAAVLAVVHYVWLVKSDIRLPLLYGAVVVLLLVVRIPFVRKKLANLRYRR